MLRTFSVFFTLALLWTLPIFGGQSVAAGLNPISHCGTERWHIKTLDDAGAGMILFNVPDHTTVDALRALPIPADWTDSNDSSRYLPAERTDYAVRAVLIGWKQEGDRDFHIVIADPNQKADTMIAEPPDPKCSTAIEGGYAAKFAAVRAALVKCFGQPTPRFKKFPTGEVVDLTGIGFFDALHGQTGVAPNGIELHPLLSVKTVSGTCPKHP